MKDISSYLDATILDPRACSKDYKKLCKDAVEFDLAAICVPPFQVHCCKEMIQDSVVKLATVIGFPAGYQTIPTKIMELRNAIEDGAQEIDYVVHRGYLSNNDFENLEEETLTWIDVCRQEGVVSKWIIEVSELAENQLDRVIEIANKFGPNYVKTSTGFYGKAVLEQVRHLRLNLDPKIKIKAAGGISDRQTAVQFIDAGADRLGVSKYEKLL